MNIYLLVALVSMGCITIAVAQNKWIWVSTTVITSGFATALSEQLDLNYWIGFLAFWSWVLVVRMIAPRLFLKRTR